MAHALSFAPAFFYGDGALPPEELPPTRRPTSVCQALKSMAPEDWDLLAREVFGAEPERLDINTVVARVIATNTCSNLNPPIEVWIDAEGFHAVLVY